MPLSIRPAIEADAPAIARVDSAYTASQRVLSLAITGTAPELRYVLAWRNGTPVETVYASYDEARTRRALKIVDLFLVAEDSSVIAGLLMVIVPTWTDAGEITDLVVDRQQRRHGVARALVDAAASWAREHRLRALWVEPRADNSNAIEFYLSYGFRLSGFNDRWNSNSDAAGQQTLFMYLELT